MSKIKIQQVRSKINAPKDQKLTLEALGFRKLYSVVEHEDTATIRGMMRKVNHLIKVID